jgi:curved DNA-binding protein CbpA
MDSAYKVLGVPGNATQEDLDQALQRALVTYSREKMAQDTKVLERVMQVREAHKILSNPDMRAAHDRKLQSALRRQNATEIISMEAVPPAWYTKPLVLGTLLVVAMFAGGSYMNYQRNKVKVAQEAAALEAKRLEAEALVRAENERRLAEERKAWEQSRDKARELQMAAEASASLHSAMMAESSAQADMRRKADAAERDKQRKESEAKSEERRRAYEAQRRVAADQQRIRELCYQQYRTPNC